MKWAAIALTLACAAAPAGAIADDMHGMSMGDGKSMPGGPADKAFMEAMQAMMKDMAVKPTGDADTDFVMMMLPHHQGAVDMAKVELQYGKDPALRELAQGIVAAQKKEIALMKVWLAKHGK